MRAIDTNVIVRILTGDDPIQAQAARQVIEAGDIFIGVTVLLETVWVLRGGYGFKPTEIADVLRSFAGLPGITLEDPGPVGQALEWMCKGMDFADALHLARAEHCSAFVTFDRKFASRAKDFTPMPVVIP